MFRNCVRTGVAITMLTGLSGCAASEVDAAVTHRAAVVVYGDASGGVTAAVQAARMGKSVILVSQYGHLGGMTSSGLGFSDLGNPKILGGLSRDFYHRVYMRYQQPDAWVRESRDTFPNKGQGVPALNQKRNWHPRLNRRWRRRFLTPW